MSTRERLLEELQPIVQVVQGLDLNDAIAAQAELERRFPLDSELVKGLKCLVREGVEAGWLCDRENEGVRFSRVRKASGNEWSIDAVHMSTPGMGHLHPEGEVDLCFAVSGSPQFDGKPEGWIVYPPRTWHVPTVRGGAMDILYFLPGGAITFGPKPEGAIEIFSPQ